MCLTSPIFITDKMQYIPWGPTTRYPTTSSTTPSTAPSTNPLTHAIHPHFHIKKNTHIPRTHRLEALDAQRQDSVLHRCISLRYDFCKATRRMKLLDSNEIRQLRDVCVFEVNGIGSIYVADLYIQYV